MVDVEIADDIGERQSSGETVSTLDGEDPGAWTGRRGEPFRKLNMLGFLKTAPAAKDGWKKCRTYREIDLAPHKTVCMYVCIYVYIICLCNIKSKYDSVGHLRFTRQQSALVTP